MNLLSSKNITQANAKIKPNTKNQTSTIGIVHLGFGAFHRAHQALITDTLMREIGGDWKIVGVNWGGVDVKSQLNPQDNLYTVGIGYNEDLSLHIVGSVDHIINSDECDEVLKYMYNRDVKVVSLTITEKGYCHNPANGRLNLEHPWIIHDLINLDKPKSAIGYLINAIQYRRNNNIAPFTPLTCDNLPENGHVLEQVVLDFAEAYDSELCAWIKTNIKFPCTMVDRIVPRTTEADVNKIEQALGLVDHACVMTEPFLQWVIEDKFINERPAWDQTSISNVIFTNNVVPFEEMKLRLLNGTHSAIAYLGYLAGYQTVSETMNDDKFKTFIRYLMDIEISPSIHIKDIDLIAYKNALIERYENTALQHRTWQIAMDGSQKIPQRWLETIQYDIDHDIQIEGLCLALAAWINYTSSIDEHGNDIDVQDPLKERFAKIWASNKDLESLIHAFLSIEEIFNKKISTNETFKANLLSALNILNELGAKESVHQFVINKKEII
ncbi:mannitol dehydrogenase family protein [Photobacterium damselae]|uniref:mannitol dehydrogenase family protein n=1 Tax=Photobacterium damselae TaxID=38293 RepID=UPI001EFC8673|nr:mannitol dehydrogenase family protein [Photobacterium damselae]MCG9780613.1 mannitol dehydrogenase family protein [Photobacterium damselae]